MPKIIGLYTITCKINGKMYLGMSKNINNRISSHKSALLKNKHGNVHLQFAFNKYGIDNFSFEIFIECDERFLASEEHYWCNLLNLRDDLYGYNIQITNPYNKHTMSLESRKKLSLSTRGKKIYTEEQRVKHKKYLATKEAKSKISAGGLKRTGIKQTDEHIQKRVRYHLGKKRDKSVGENISKSIYKRKKKIHQFSKNGVLIRSYESLCDVNRITNYDIAFISRICHNRGDSAYGYIWSFKYIT